MMSLDEMRKGRLANGMEDMLRIFLEDEINEFHYTRQNGERRYELK